MPKRQFKKQVHTLFFKYLKVTENNIKDTQLKPPKGPLK